MGERLPSKERLMAEANLAVFDLVRYVLSGTELDPDKVAELVLRYQAKAMAMVRGPGEYAVSVTPEQTLLFSALASMCGATFVQLCQVRERRSMSTGEVLAELARYQEILVTGGEL